MIFVEDVLAMMAVRLRFNDRYAGPLVSEWHNSFVLNVSGHVAAGRPLSTEQSRIVLKLAAKLGDLLVEAGDLSRQSLDTLLGHPTHRQPTYASASIRKEVRFLGGDRIGFRFKFNEMILRDMRALGYRSEFTVPTFDREHRLWVVPVTVRNLPDIRAMIAEHRFEMDATVRDYLALVASSAGKPSTAAFDQKRGTVLATIRDNELLACWITHVAEGAFA